MPITTLEGGLQMSGSRYAIVAARWHAAIVNQLEQGAIDTLQRHAVPEEKITVIRCPGAFEIPLTVKQAIKAGVFHGIIALGVVIRGDTPHFDYIAGACANGLARANWDSDIPVSFGVLTVNTLEQALERAGTKAGNSNSSNKGAEAAMATLEMVSLINQMKALTT